MSKRRLPPEDLDDDFEYEIEEPDAEVIAHERELAQRELKKAEAAIDVDEVYKQLDQQQDLHWDFKPQFGVRSILIATTICAVAITFFRFGTINGNVVAFLICGTLLALGCAHAWLGQQERKRREEVIQKRHDQLAQARASTVDGNEAQSPFRNRRPDPARSPPERHAAPKVTIAEALLTLLIAGAITAMVMLTGSAASGAVAMGALALTGFAVQAAEVVLPRPIVFGWWVALVAFGVLLVMSV